MKKIFAIIIVLVIAGCKLDTKKFNKPSYEVTFSQVGYYKNVTSKLRYFTFNVQVWENGMLIDSVVPNHRIFYMLRKHGADQAHTYGAVTASFYYVNPPYAPDITLMTAQEANDAAHAHNPLASVWIKPSGLVDFITKPEY